MRAVIKAVAGPGCSFVHDRPEPDLLPGQVRLAVAATSVCGTDASIHAHGPAARALGLRLPITMGHEVAGTVIEVGPHTAGPALGTRVGVETHLACGRCWACREGSGHNCADLALLGVDVDGAFAERVVVPAASCFEVPEEMSLETAALLEPAGSAMHAVQRCGVPMGGASVLVSGAGPVGLVLVEIALALGARSVVVVEPNAARRRLATARGALALDLDSDPVGEADRRTRERRGFDVAFECSGVLPALEALLDRVRNEGTVMVVGLAGGDLPVPVTRTFITRGLTVRGSWGRAIWSTWEQLSALVGAGHVDLDGLVTHRLPLSDLPAALALMRGDAGKVLLLPSLADSQEPGRTADAGADLQGVPA
ncbi:zinc-dependent alcohol dehydrogenase [Nocardioides bruguierae]|uniref:zinc-dependent alcohol dehydrogenase n=1 Tax=Nocardioides bruguierae TaxID=2945102 RepID=UPI00202118A2|nr:alcohol dehydrogenase catalytic domain-containing protein [Nocardioides bruguierae]MCL8026868.1 alcohol dehydrogenase catalytic domain-containing protein [Nocardioides bruguierae]